MVKQNSLADMLTITDMLITALFGYEIMIHKSTDNKVKSYLTSKRERNFVFCTVSFFYLHHTTDILSLMK